jgi:outer membrane protein
VQSAAKGVKAAKGQLFPVLSFGANANTNYSSAARQDNFLGTSSYVSNEFVTVNGTNYNVTKQQSNFSSSKINYGKQLNNNLFTSFGFNLRVPVFNSFQQRNRIKLSQLILKNNEAIAVTTKTQLQQAIEQAYINMNTAAERHKTLLEQADAFSESFRAAEIRFNNGVGNSIDYLTAKNNLDRSNINLINARYDFVLRTKLLDYYQGKPLW